MKTNEWKEITDPEELFRLRREGWEVQRYHEKSDGWYGWNGANWDCINKFRARPQQPKMKKVKMLCFYSGASLFWHESGKGHAYRCRVPSEDKEIEVPDDN